MADPPPLTLKRICVNDTVFYVFADRHSILRVDDLSDRILMARMAGDRDLSELIALHGKTAVEEALLELSRVLGDTQDSTPLALGQKPATYVLTLSVAEDCNLACTYCYQGLNKLANRMSDETAIAAIDFIAGHTMQGDRIKIIFYGGEPLLNWSAITTGLEHAIRTWMPTRGLEFWLLTNGTLLTEERARYLLARGVRLAISIDGPADIHDRCRRFPGGRGSHATVLGNVAKLRGRVSASVTLLKQDIETLPTTLRYLQQMGFVELAVNPVESDSPEFAFVEGDWRKLAETYDLIAANCESRPQSIRGYLERVTRPTKESYRCSAGRKGFFIAPDGRVFPCAGFRYLDTFEMGHVETGLDRRRRSELAAAQVDSIPACQHCWARYYCQGPCFYKAVKENGTPLVPSARDCQRMQILIESALRFHLAERYHHHHAQTE